MTDGSDSIDKLQNLACLVVQGPDFAEAVATVATVVGKYAARVLTFEQHTEPGEPQELYQRIEFVVDALNEVFDDIEIELKQRLEPLGADLDTDQPGSPQTHGGPSVKVGSLPQ